MSKTKSVRRSFTLEQKAAILRRHLVDKVSVVDLCEEHSLQPSVFYGWQKAMLLNLEASLAQSGQKQRDSTQARLERENEQLRAKLARKDEVIAEVAAEMVSLKKELGEL